MCAARLPTAVTAPPWAAGSADPPSVHCTTASPELVSFAAALAARLRAAVTSPGTVPPPVPLPPSCPPLVARLFTSETVTPTTTLSYDPSVAWCFCTCGNGLDMLRGEPVPGQTAGGGLYEVWTRFGMLPGPLDDLLYRGQQCLLMLLPREPASGIAAEVATWEGLTQLVERVYPLASKLLARDLEAMHTGGMAYFEACEAAALPPQRLVPPSGKAFSFWDILTTDGRAAGAFFGYTELLAARAALQGKGIDPDGPSGVPPWQVRCFLFCQLKCNAHFNGTGLTPAGYPELLVENAPLHRILAAGGVLVELGCAVNLPLSVLQQQAALGAPYAPFYAAASGYLAQLEPPPPALASFRAARAARVAAAGGASCTLAGALTQVQLPCVTDSMRQWQQGRYSCGEACCFVDQCGQATCDAAASPHCTGLLTPAADAAAAAAAAGAQGSAPLPPRYLCLTPDCAEVYNLGSVCAQCYASPAWLHPHTQFVRVDTQGRHSVESRAVGRAAARPLSELSLPALRDALMPSPPPEGSSSSGNGGVLSGQLCALCGDTAFGVSEAEVGAGAGLAGGVEWPASIPGCPRRHHGLEAQLQQQPVCRGCVQSALEARGQAFLLTPIAAADGSSAAATASTAPTAPAAAPCITCSAEAMGAVYWGVCRRARAAARSAWCSAATGSSPWAAAAAAVAPVLSLPPWRAEALAAAAGLPPQEAASWEAFLALAAKHFQALHPQALVKQRGAEGLQLLPGGALPLPLPPPLQRSDGGFTLDTLQRRVPALLRETLRASAAPAALVLAVEQQLCAPLEAGALLPPPGKDPHGLWAAGSVWAASSAPGSFWWQENVVYAHLVGLWEGQGLWPLQDPFCAQKAEALESAAAAFEAGLGAGEEGGSSSTGAAATGAAVTIAQQLYPALLRSLWGNRADLSLSAGKVLAGAGGSEEEALLLCNDAMAAIKLLERSSAFAAATATPLRLCIVLDNCGLELLQDLRLVDCLLAAFPHCTLTLQAKRLPTFVSDATEADVAAHVQWLGQRLAQCAPAVALGQRLSAALATGRLVVTSHPFWNSPRPLWGLPVELEHFLAGQALAVFKGDANYRRLLGDLHWPYATGFGGLVGGYAPCPVLALRTCKCGLAVGIAPGAQARAEASSREDWLTSGKYGLVQLALPQW
jgi:hypothetical protein